jgi:molybdopterin-guanine dinucleotide biosynthesis protein
MRLVSVAGACSRSGKTAAAVTLLRFLGRGGASAVKFTTTDDVFERCPRGKPCVVCDIDVPFRLIQDPTVLREAGTDTFRLIEAGARTVLWAIARQGAVVPAWNAVRARLDDDDTVVMEGSTIVEHTDPAHVLFVAHPFLSPERWKPTSARLLAEADVVVVNRPAAETREPSAEVLEALRARRGDRGIRIADVARPLLEWAPDLAAALGAREVDPPAGLGEVHADIPRP